MGIDYFGVRTPALSTWDDDRKSKIKDTIECKQTGMAGTHARETDVINWSAESGNPKYFAQRQEGTKDQQDPTKYKLTEIPNHSEWTDGQVDTVVDNVIADVPSGKMGGVAGWLVFHESYGGAYSKMERAIERILDKTSPSGISDTKILADGSVQGFSDETDRNNFASKFWKDTDRCFFMAQKYSWKTNTTIEDSVTELEAEWRRMVDWFITNTARKWIFTAQAHKDTQHPNPGEGVTYRFCTKPEMLLSAVGAVAHGAKGVLFYLFDTVGDNNLYGMYQSNCSECDTMRDGAAEAGERLDDIADYLSGYSYLWTGSGDPGYFYNYYKSGGQTYLRTFEQAWLINTITSDPDDTSKWVEVCRWQKSASDESYVICSRRPQGAHTVSVSFKTTRKYDIDGSYQGQDTSCQITIPAGDAKVLRLYS